MKNTFKQNTIALVYDFDETLSPQPMQEYTVLPEIEEDPALFWKECSKEAERLGADKVLTYMRLLIEKLEAKKTSLDKEALKKLAERIEYFPGLEDGNWFQRMNAHVKSNSEGSVEVTHYIISAGLKEILDGTKINKYFKKMFGSEYFFDHHNAAKFPTVVINETSKTQYLFRINKGVEDPNESINEYMPEEQRPVPFSNMLYIGDGLTDVPSMTVTKKNGGFAIAVHKPDDKKSIGVCKKLAKGNRIDYYAPANYEAGERLEKQVKVILDLMVSKIMFEKEKFSFHQEMNRYSEHGSSN